MKMGLLHTWQILNHKQVLLIKIVNIKCYFSFCFQKYKNNKRGGEEFVVRLDINYSR